MEKYKKNIPPKWEPPVPAWSAKIQNNCTEVVITYIGVQMSRDHTKEPRDFRSWYTQMMKVKNAPIHTERGRVIDSENYINDFYISYWNSKEDYEKWRSTSVFTNWWNAEERTEEGVGYWLEPMIVPTERFETLFSSEDKAGAATIFNDFKGPIKEHNYFGGMRDRIPYAEVNLLQGNQENLKDESHVDSLGKRVHLKTPENLAIIRSAQNLSQSKQEEKRRYDEEVYPHLIAGMDFIENNPQETGCCCSRFSEELTLDGKTTQKTFGFAYFLTLGHLEKWSKTHPTHLRIFHSFLEMMQTMEQPVDIKLWHEVSVLPEGQTFEYVNCHPKTGLLPWFK